MIYSVAVCNNGVSCLNLVFGNLYEGRYRPLTVEFAAAGQAAVPSPELAIRVWRKEVSWKLCVAFLAVHRLKGGLVTPHRHLAERIPNMSQLAS
jgi:hypothetical protein